MKRKMMRCPVCKKSRIEFSFAWCPVCDLRAQTDELGKHEAKRMKRIISFDQVKPCPRPIPAWIRAAGIMG